MFLILLIIIFVVISIFLAINLYLTWNFNYWQYQNVKGPTPKRIYGTFPKTSQGKLNLIEELHEIYLKYKSTESFVGVFAARSPKLFILDPSLAGQILTQNFKHFRDNESSQWTSPEVEQLRFASPFVSVGEAWKEKRSELVPNLTVNRIKSFHTTMQNSALKMLQFIEQHNENMETWDAKDLANRFTGHIMSKYIWGIEENTFESPSKHSVVHEMAVTMLKQTLICVKYYGDTAVFPLIRKLKPVRFFPAISDKFFKQLALDAIKQRATSSCQQNDVINHLTQLRQKKNLNDIQIAGHTTTVLIDGFETGANLIAHCLLLLSRNPRVQEKLRKIILDLKQQAGNDLSFDQLMDLPYLEQCIQETLRLFPPLATLFKLCTEAITLESPTHGCKVNLKPNDVVYISAYSFHYDGEYFEQPEKYWPERFDEELGGIKKYRDMGVFLPFGDGPRMCPGMKLGLFETKVAIAELVANYEIATSPNTRQDNKLASESFLLTLEGGIEINLKRI